MGTKDKRDDAPYVPKWDKPKVMLLDLPGEVEGALKGIGYNVATGSFGRPYSVQMDGTFSLVPLTGALPNYAEQEVVILDLTAPSTSTSPGGKPHLSRDQPNWWVHQGKALVDPRPRIMAFARESTDRILEHGGVLIVFGMPRQSNRFILAKEERYRPLEKIDDINEDNWSFCSLFRKSMMRIESDAGEELTPSEQSDVFSEFFRRHSNRMRYTATFNAEYPLREVSTGYTFHSLIETKYGVAAGGVILDSEKKGIVVLLPQCDQTYKTDVVVDLVHNVLPQACPQVFPHAEGGKWVHMPAYEHPEVLAIAAEQQRIRLESEARISVLDKAIAAERDARRYLHDLLTRKGDDLVQAVKAALENIGFTKVVDVDEHDANPNAKQEDLQVQDSSPVLLVEVKGLSGFPREGDTLQVVKYIPRRMKEWGRTDIFGVVIVNHQCNVPGLSRDHDRVFTEPQVQDALNHDVTLVTTWDIFKLIRGMQKWGWPSESITPLFYGKGRIAATPKHYREIGTVGHFYDKIGVVSVDIHPGETLVVGDTIGFALEDGYYEEVVASLQVEKSAVEQAAGGQRAGHKTVLPRRVLPDGLHVYKVG